MRNVLAAFIVFTSLGHSAFAAVSPSDPPVAYAGPVTFSQAIASNVLLNSGEAMVVDGAALDGYFWATGSLTQATWAGGSIDSYLQADAGATITAVGADLLLTYIGPYFTGQRYLLAGHLVSGQSISIDAYTYSGGTVVVQSIPEPSSALMLAMGLFAVASMAARRATKHIESPTRAAGYFG